MGQKFGAAKYFLFFLLGSPLSPYGQPPFRWGCRFLLVLQHLQNGAVGWDIADIHIIL